MNDEPRIYRVAEVAHLLKNSVEGATRGLWVTGEVGRVTQSPAGHVYFTLKEGEQAMLDCVLYKREAMRFARHVVEGERVELLGTASFWAPRGRLQWIASQARPAGKGDLLERLLRLRRKLEAEGLFALEKKRALPPHPRVVGVVTSRTGAAFGDIRTVALRRAPVRLILSSCLVQGAEAPSSIVAAIDRIEKLEGLDVLIVGRGGGSQEDLMAWNDERVVRRIAACRVPVVCAVGHEIDSSLADLAADVRAATPSQAAELVVPDVRGRALLLRREEARLRSVLQHSLSLSRVSLMEARRKLGEPRLIIGQNQVYLDEESEALRRAMREGLRKLERRRIEVFARLSSVHPRARLLSLRGALGPLVVRLDGAARRNLERDKTKLTERMARLDALSPLKVLGRGYALALDGERRPIFEAGRVRAGDEVTVILARGSLRASVLEASLESPFAVRHESSEESRQDQPS